MHLEVDEKVQLLLDCLDSYQDGIQVLFYGTIF
jgi:hypothetical protein